MNTNQTRPSRLPTALLSRQDFVGGLAIIAVAALAYWLGRGLPGGTDGGMGPGTLPKGLAVLLGLLGLLLAGDSVFREGSRLGRWSIRGPLFILGALVVFGLAVRPLGVAVAGPLAIVVSALASAEHSPALPNVPTTKEAGRSPQALSGLVKSEVARWTPILKSAQVTP